MRDDKIGHISRDLAANLAPLIDGSQLLVEGELNNCTSVVFLPSPVLAHPHTKPGAGGGWAEARYSPKGPLAKVLSRRLTHGLTGYMENLDHSAGQRCFVGMLHATFISDLPRRCQAVALGLFQNKELKSTPRICLVQYGCGSTAPSFPPVGTLRAQLHLAPTWHPGKRRMSARSAHEVMVHFVVQLASTNKPWLHGNPWDCGLWNKAPHQVLVQIDEAILSGGVCARDGYVQGMKNSFNMPIDVICLGRPESRELVERSLRRAGVSLSSADPESFTSGTRNTADTLSKEEMQDRLSSMFEGWCTRLQSLPQSLPQRRQRLQQGRRVRKLCLLTQTCVLPSDARHRSCHCYAAQTFWALACLAQ
eukprot:363740-Chlamydomonas_euryale.AAC.28